MDMNMDLSEWSRLVTISTFDNEDAGLLNNYICSDNCHSLNMNNEPMALTMVKPTTATSLLIEGLIELICKLIEDDNRNVEISYKVICEKLHSMFLIDDSYARNEFADIRGYYENQIYKIICAVRDQKISIGFSTSENNEIYTETFWSRYKREFEEIRFIAGGGFGKVFQARHRLDSIEYAVKKIKINSTKIKLCHFSEVKTIASLNHPSIVQYKSAWLEPISPEAKVNENIECLTNSNDPSEFCKNINCESQNIKLEASNGKHLKLMKYTSKYNKDYNPKTTNAAILYIQMSLCKFTLKEWLSSRNILNNIESYSLTSFKTINKIPHINIARNIFFQILNGLDYIHSKKIVHHDIKPSNIFLDFGENGDIIAQLGDFGLACPLQDDHRGYPLGTKLYAAPEQLQGECNPKSDVYSLGIVLLELLTKCNTDMERIKTIENAREGIYQSELTKPSVQLLRSLLSSTTNRPTTSEVLNLLRKYNLEDNVWPTDTLTEGKIEDMKNNFQSLKNYKLEINSLKNENIEKNKKICDLNTILKEKNMEIEQLREIIRKYKT